jgi:hypothetical protein
MPGTIEEVHLRRPVCNDGCGPLAPLRDTPLHACEAALEAHYLSDHNGLSPEGEDA